MTAMTTDGKTDQALPYGNEAAVAEFIHKNGITRCPTACVVPTQAEITEADRAALAEHAIAQERVRQARAALRARPFWPAAARWSDIA
jgi:hypothetical protein